MLGLLLVIAYGLFFSPYSVVSAHAAPEKRVALVIGNGAYIFAPALQNPPNDAADVAITLTKLGFSVNLKINATKAEMDTAIASFARAAQTADASLFYYAGHGMQFKSTNYILPIDAKLQDDVSLLFEVVKIDDIRASLADAQGVKIMVLDACRSNPLAEQLARLTKGLDRSGAEYRGLARMGPTKGMLIAYATQANEVAADGDGRNSPFTKALLSNMVVPGLELGQVFRRVSADVQRDTGGRQQPVHEDSLTEDFYFAAAGPSAFELDQEAWEAAVNANTAAAIEVFIESHPASRFLSDARFRLSAMTEEAGNVARVELADLQALEERATIERIRDRVERAALREEVNINLERRRLEARRKADHDRLVREWEVMRHALDAEIAGGRDPDHSTPNVEEPASVDTAPAPLPTPPPPPVSASQNPSTTAPTAPASPPVQATGTPIPSAPPEQPTPQHTAQTPGSAPPASSPPTQTQVASASPTPPGPTAAVAPGPLVPSVVDAALVAAVKKEILRLGCSINGPRESDWFKASDPALLDLTRYAKLDGEPLAPTQDLLDRLRGYKGGRLCPLICASWQRESGGRCVAIARTCRMGEHLAASGRCVANPAATRHAEVVLDHAGPRLEVRHRRHTYGAGSAPSGGEIRCSTQTVC